MAETESIERITAIGQALFEAVGAPPPQALCVTDNLVQSSLMGVDSHGVMRIPEYLELVQQGSIIPGTDIEIEPTSDSTAIVDCGYNFGVIGAERAMQQAIELAKSHRVSSVITRRSNHVGRLGAFVQLAADAGMIGIATCNSPIYGHFVLPWGGREGRLATNPIAYAVPSAADPIVADISTSVAPEGKVRYHLNENKTLPTGWIVDAAGQPSTNAQDFYGPPRGGILPLGANAGHKGYALGLLVEILGSALAGVSSTDRETVGNGVCFIVLNPAAFLPEQRFRELVSETIAYMKSSPPAEGFSEVFVPGEIEFRCRRERLQTGIPIDPATREKIRAEMVRLGVTV